MTVTIEELRLCHNLVAQVSNVIAKLLKALTFLVAFEHFHAKTRSRVLLIYYFGQNLAPNKVTNLFDTFFPFISRFICFYEYLSQVHFDNLWITMYIVVFDSSLEVCSHENLL